MLLTVRVVLDYKQHCLLALQGHEYCRLGHGSPATEQSGAWLEETELSDRQDHFLLISQKEPVLYLSSTEAGCVKTQCRK